MTDSAPIGRARIGERDWILLLGLAVGLLASELAETVFATALPTVAGDLGHAAQLAWITTAYLLAGTAVMPVYGRLSDRAGRRPLLLTALGLFLAGSVTGALAGGFATVVLARVIQGLGGGGLLILVQSVVADTVEPRRRVTVMSGIGAVFAVAAVAGPVAGGWLSEHVGWRSLFWVGIPFALLAALVVWLRLPAGVPTDRAAAEPPAPLRLFRTRDFTTTVLATGLLAVAAFGSIAYLPTYLQMGLGLRPTTAGLVMLALVGGLAIGTVLTARLVKRTGRTKPPLVVGSCSAAAGLLLLAATSTGAGLGLAVAGLIVLGLGVGSAWEVAVVVAQTSVGDDAVGTATSVHSLGREIGVVVGTAVVGVWFTARLQSLLAGQLDDQTVRSLGPATLDALPDGALLVVHQAYVGALAPVLAAVAPLALAAAVVFAALRSGKLARVRTGAPASEADGGEPGRIERADRMIR
ncbi:MFS transporter [Microlunatus ginsengisoli]|uniref:MDR family MFS transporter n=1 Tax=Microlunatus ginsengisoli TaxID=363863 RepID=A0ABP7AVP2_9ACTN